MNARTTSNEARGAFPCGHTYDIANWYTNTVNGKAYPRCRKCQMARSLKRAAKISAMRAERRLSR